MKSLLILLFALVCSSAGAESLPPNAVAVATTIDNGHLVLQSTPCQNGGRQYVLIGPFGQAWGGGCWISEGEYIVGLSGDMQRFKWRRDDFRVLYGKHWPKLSR